MKKITESILSKNKQATKIQVVTEIINKNIILFKKVVTKFNP